MRTIELEYALTKSYFLSSILIATRITKNRILTHECDLIVVDKKMQVTEYEIKTSISDLKNDFKKHHGHRCNKIKRMYYVIPLELLDKAKDIIPMQYGIIIVYSYKNIKGGTSYATREERKPKSNKNFETLTKDELLELHRLENKRKQGYLRKIIDLGG